MLKKPLVALLLFFMPIIALAQYTNENAVKTTQIETFRPLIEMTTAYKLAVEQCYAKFSSLPLCNANSHYVPPRSTAPEGLIDVNQGIITVTPGAQNGILASDTYILTPKVVNNALQWTASGDAVTKGYASTGSNAENNNNNSAEQLSEQLTGPESIGVTYDPNFKIGSDYNLIVDANVASSMGKKMLAANMYMPSESVPDGPISIAALYIAPIAFEQKLYEMYETPELTNATVKINISIIPIGSKTPQLCYSFNYDGSRDAYRKLYGTSESLQIPLYQLLSTRPNLTYSTWCNKALIAEKPK